MWSSDKVDGISSILTNKVNVMEYKHTTVALVKQPAVAEV